MTIARAHLVDVATTCWYHCVTRCVRRAFLLGEGPLDRKEWIDRRLLCDRFGLLSPFVRTRCRWAEPHLRCMSLMFRGRVS